MTAQINKDVSIEALSGNIFNRDNKVQQSNEVKAGTIEEAKKSKDVQDVENARAVSTTKTDEEAKKEIEEAVEVIADFMSLPMKNVNFLTDDSSQKTVIKVFDSESKELIKQFPSDEVLEIAQRIIKIREDVGKKTGILLDDRV